jgi:hypothetical protein
MSVTVDAATNQRDNVACDTPTSRDSAVADIGSRPTMRLTMRSLNFCEYCKMDQPIAP